MLVSLNLLKVRGLLVSFGLENGDCFCYDDCKIGATNAMHTNQDMPQRKRLFRHTITLIRRESPLIFRFTSEIAPESLPNHIRYVIV